MQPSRETIVKLLAATEAAISAHWKLDIKDFNATVQSRMSLYDSKDALQAMLEDKPVATPT